ncbi:hypothetical protein Droror1_Dr00011960 [Drosera rotundifolia]
MYPFEFNIVVSFALTILEWRPNRQPSLFLSLQKPHTHATVSANLAAARRRPENHPQPPFLPPSSPFLAQPTVPPPEHRHQSTATPPPKSNTHKQGEKKLGKVIVEGRGQQHHGERRTQERLSTSESVSDDDDSVREDPPKIRLLQQESELAESKAGEVSANNEDLAVKDNPIRQITDSELEDKGRDVSQKLAKGTLRSGFEFWHDDSYRWRREEEKRGH